MIEININRTLHGAAGPMQLRFTTTISEGEFVGVYGASGAGKTSVLRMLAGLLTPSDGHIVVNDQAWFDKINKVNLKPQLRNIGMVFQDYSLFPNMTVRENLEYALMKGQSNKIVDDLLQVMELGQLNNKKPALLSGGQKQRVALARALVRRPKLLLLDEPFSALDPVMQSTLQDYVAKAHREFKLTTIMISHDLLEVIKMTKRVLVLENGVITKDGLPAAVLPLSPLRALLASDIFQPTNLGL
jgi:molybdate transport system ATP-binding protein